MMWNNQKQQKIMQADPCVTSNAPLACLWKRARSPLRFCFLVRGGGSVRGTQTLTQGSRHVLKKWGNTYQAHFDGKIRQWKHMLGVSTFWQEWANSSTKLLQILAHHIVIKSDQISKLLHRTTRHRIPASRLRLWKSIAEYYLEK